MTKRSYRQGRTERAPEARLSQDELEALEAVLKRDGVKYAEWLRKKITEDEMDNLKAGDSVNVKYNGRWHKENGKFVVFHITQTWRNADNKRQYSVRENSDTFNADEVRKA